MLDSLVLNLKSLCEIQVSRAFIRHHKSHRIVIHKLVEQGLSLIMSLPIYPPASESVMMSLCHPSQTFFGTKFSLLIPTSCLLILPIPSRIYFQNSLPNSKFSRAKIFIQILTNGYIVFFSMFRNCPLIQKCKLSYLIPR